MPRDVAGMRVKGEWFGRMALRERHVRKLGVIWVSTHLDFKRRDDNIMRR